MRIDDFLRLPAISDSVKPAGPGQWKARCPAHEDHNPSLSIRVGDNAKILLKCFVGCPTEAVCQALGVTIKDLFPPDGRPREGARSQKPIVATYDYHGAGGELLYQAVRFESKGFAQRRPGGKDDEWIWNLKGVQRVLYRVGEVTQANSKDWIFIVEGEKDADALTKIGLVATTNAGGAGKWRPEYNSVLHGRRVAILPDNDKPGRDHAAKVAESLLPVASDVRIVTLPDLPDKGDVSDWLTAGGTKEQLQELIESAKPYESEQPRRLTPSGPNCPYEATEHGLFLVKGAREGAETRERLTNFTAKIVADSVHDDGIEKITSLEIEARLNGRVTPCTVTAPEFLAMSWPLTQLGGQAIIEPGTAKKDHARTAIQRLSEAIQRRTIYTHTGWRKLDNEWVYLHAGGALGSHGSVSSVATSLADNLALYDLPAPPSGEALQKALHASLRLLEGLVPPNVAWPLFCLPWCAVLGIGTFSAHLDGNTGTGKTQLAALFQQHFGCLMDATHLPASWSSTGNALQATAFAAKDALLTVDDFAPSGSQGEIQQLHRKAGDMIRGQANRSARQRMRADTSLRPSKPPRGLLLSTGEDIPGGQSVQARMLVLRLGENDVKWDRLTQCQADAASGLYAQALAAFIRWASCRYDTLRNELRERASKLRLELSEVGGHRRMHTAVAELMSGAEIFLRFALECGAIDSDRRAQLEADCRTALTDVGIAQAAYQCSADPARRFLELVHSAIASGAAHVAGPEGEEPLQPQGWGWRRNVLPGHFQGEYQPMGSRIGWVEDDRLYLDPSASYKAAQSMTAGRDGIAVGADTLRKRLKDKGWLLCDANRQRLTMRRTFEGSRREVICLNKDLVSLCV